ncbi:hypothetical protein PhCBS80983_g03671 [Powellomyces hirtus]|uniref:Monooxygenase n=1 Tax=Powellomyces hirtus TaxID=109895 RepID=A0A507E2P9_9FUNG|nr:hypothetical protein PhCBS80983_g03671 [Powellomyces hirtus]
MDANNVSVAIIGAGLSGLCAAIRLKEDVGITQFTIYEASEDVGGTWLHNQYPGCGCDVESHLYSFSFHPKPDWTCEYANQPEIRSYISSVTDSYNLRPHIRFRTRVVSLNWNPVSAHWRLKLSISDPTSHKISLVDTTASIVISAMGPLNVPAIPKNLDPKQFEGPIMHTAQWDTNVDLTGKKVAVVGNAASGAQVVGDIVEKVGQLVVFQRTPNWIVPRSNFKYPAWMMWVFRNVPLVQRIWRTLLFLRREVIFYNAFKPTNLLARLAAKQYRSLMKQSIPPHLRDTLIPNYAFGCKRVLVSSSYLPALTNPKTTLVTTSISHLTPKGLQLTDTTHIDADVVVLATGFDVQHLWRDTTITGTDNETLAEKWTRAKDSYKGLAIHGFPNFYTLLGPYSGLAHSSVISIVECQVNYIVQLVARQIATNTPALNVTRQAETDHVAFCEKGLEGSAWKTGGCKSWYIDSATGSPAALWPHTVSWFWWSTRKVDWTHHEPVMTAPRDTKFVHRSLTSLLALLVALTAAHSRSPALAKRVQEFVARLSNILLGR